MQTHLSRAQAIFANVFGNTLEIYDFALFGTLAPVIAAHFFPVENKGSSLLMVYVVFAASFVMRPLGGMLFGYIGDTFGRKKSLLISIISMVIPSTLLGLLPDYAVIGMWAPISLVFIRLLQGLSNGGEYCGSMVYLAELSGKNKNKVGFYSSFGSIGGLMGVFMGVVFTTVLQYDMGSSFQAWGWRIPFVMSACIGIVGFVLRRHMPESAVFLEYKKSGHKKNNVIQDLNRYKWSIFQTASMVFHSGVIFWMIFSYIVTYYTKTLHFQSTNVYIADTLGLCIGILCVVVSGKLSERVSLKTLLVWVLVGFILFTYLLNTILLQHLFIVQSAVIHIIMCVLAGLYLGAIPGQMVVLFPAEIRCTYIGVSYNTAILFSGLVPAIVTFLIIHHTLEAPGILLTFSSVLALIFVLAIDKNKQNNF